MIGSWSSLSKVGSRRDAFVVVHLVCLDEVWNHVHDAKDDDWEKVEPDRNVQDAEDLVENPLAL